MTKEQEPKCPACDGDMKLVSGLMSSYKCKACAWETQMFDTPWKALEAANNQPARDADRARIEELRAKLEAVKQLCDGRILNCTYKDQPIRTEKETGFAKRIKKELER